MQYEEQFLTEEERTFENKQIELYKHNAEELDKLIADMIEWAKTKPSDQVLIQCLAWAYPYEIRRLHNHTVEGEKRFKETFVKMFGNSEVIGIQNA